MALLRMIIKGSGGAVLARSPCKSPADMSSWRAGLSRLESGAGSPPPIKVGEEFFSMSLSFKDMFDNHSGIIFMQRGLFYGGLDILRILGSFLAQVDDLIVRVSSCVR